MRICQSLSVKGIKSILVSQSVSNDNDMTLPLVEILAVS